MQTFAERLEAIIKDTTLSVRGFESIVGVSEGTFNKVIKNNTDTSTNNIRKIFLAYPEYSIEWLVTGRDKIKREYIEGEEESLIRQISEAQKTLDALIKTYDRIKKKKGS